MALRIERDVLSHAVSSAGRAAASTGMAVMRGVHLVAVDGEATATGTDQDMTIEVAAKGDGNIDTVLPATLLREVVNSLPPGAVTVTADGDGRGSDEVTIESGRTVVKLRPYLVGDFPRTPYIGGEDVVVDVVELRKGLEQVVGAAGRDSARPILTGVQLAAEGTGLRLVATDSYRLAVRDIEGLGAVVGEGRSVLVPQAGLGELVRAMKDETKVSIRIGSEGHSASFAVGGTRITTRLIEGEFPNYRQLFPDPASQPNRLSFASEPLLEALHRMTTLAPTNTPVLRLHLGRDDGMFGVGIVNAEIGEANEDVDADYQGAPMQIAFNPHYLRYGVEACTGERVTLAMTDALRPATLTGADDAGAFTYLLMPVRVS